MSEPLIYTTKGNVPCGSLRLNPVWDIQDAYIKLSVEHWLDDEMVRNDVYVYDKQGVSAQGVAAAIA